MGVLSSVRAVRWARKHQPERVSYWAALAHERFPPDDLLRQAVEAEQAGFDGVSCSDHLAPWWTNDTAPTNSGSAWVWLGAAAHATQRAQIGSAVTSIVHRYNPVVVAQNAATLELLAPGRAFLGVGSGEAMNEVPAGMDWPAPAEQLERTEEALIIITRLLRGESEGPDSQCTNQIIASSDPSEHVKRIKAVQKLGATTMVLMNVSGGDPHAALRVYGESVLPELRAA